MTQSNIAIIADNYQDLVDFSWTDVTKDKKGKTVKEVKHSDYFTKHYSVSAINTGTAVADMVNLDALNNNEWEQAFTHQISANIIAGQMATYYVCRDMAHAQANLEEKTFNTMLKNVVAITNFSSSKIRRFLEVGKSTRLKELYEQDKLTNSWTVQYFLATCKKEVWDSFKDKKDNLLITKEMTLKDIKEKFGLVQQSDEVVIAQIVVDKKTYDNADKDERADLIRLATEVSIDDETLKIKLSDSKANMLSDS